MNLANSLKSLGIADPSGSGWLAVLFTFLLALIVTWRLIPTIRKFALEVGWADQPNARRLNQEPLPNAGGLAIYAGVIAALVLASLLRPIELQGVLAQVLTILLGGSILVLVGFIDDQFGLPPSVRLWAQVTTALLLVGNGISIQVAFGTPIDSLLSMALTVLWVVGITNAVNLMDGMDGLAGGISFITAISLLGVSAQFDNRAAATLVLAALGGAAPSILGKLQLNTIYALIPTVLFLLLPVIDTTQVFVRRLMAGKNPLSTPGKDHLHHRLLAWGLSQRNAAFILWSITLGCNLLAMKVQGMSLPVMLVTAIGIILLLGFTVWQRMLNNP
jgi:UDP-GlcNAc:undecaprenyl-phosphate GlcNAc-1-phosphate transferase